MRVIVLVGDRVIFFTTFSKISRTVGGSDPVNTDNSEFYPSFKASTTTHLDSKPQVYESSKIMYRSSCKFNTGIFAQVIYSIASLSDMSLMKIVERILDFAD